MFIRRALFPLLLILWACGDDDPPPVAPDPGAVLRPSGELQPWDLSAIVPIDSVRSMPEGMPLYLRTEFVNGELADLEMRFVAVVDDFLPPMPVIMVEASDPVLIQLGGIAQGMSGSPLFSEEGTWGAIAYAFTNQTSAPYYCFATPIEWVIGKRGTAPVARPAAAWGGAGIVPLKVLRVVTGLNSGSPWAGALPATLTQERQESFEAGRPLAVALLLGEITGGAIGTISYVDGDRVYGFGHPMDQFGSVELPIIEARVLGEVSNLAAPYKFATLNPTVRGTLTEDRLPAVRGVLDDGPELVPIRSVLTLPSGEVELVHEMPTRVEQAGLVGLAAFSPLSSRVDNEADHSLRVAVEVSFVETDSMLDRSRLYAGPEERLHSLISQADSDLADALQKLLHHQDDTLTVREAEVRVEVLPEARFAKVTGVAADTVVAPGDMLTVTTTLRVGRRNDREIDLVLSLPDPLVAGAYKLEAGAAVLLDDPDAARGGSFFGDLFGAPAPDAEETLEDVFARVNEEDRSVLLKARLTPLLEEPGFEGDGVTGVGPGPAGESAMVSTREAVGLVLTGTASTRVRVVVE